METKKEEETIFKIILATFIFFIINIQNTDAAFIDIVWDLNTILYGIAAGIAILLITIHGIKWKLAESPEAREEAKRGILNVIFGLAIIIIAANLVSLIL